MPKVWTERVRGSSSAVLAREVVQPGQAAQPRERAGGDVDGQPVVQGDARAAASRRRRQSPLPPASDAQPSRRATRSASRAARSATGSVP